MNPMDKVGATISASFSHGHYCHARVTLVPCHEQVTVVHFVHNVHIVHNVHRSHARVTLAPSHARVTLAPSHARVTFGDIMKSLITKVLKMPQEKHQPKTRKSPHFTPHFINVPLSRLTEIQATKHTHIESNRNSGFLHEKEDPHPPKTVPFSCKIGTFRAKLRQTVYFLSPIEPIFDQNMSPFVYNQQFFLSAKYTHLRNPVVEWYPDLRCGVVS